MMLRRDVLKSLLALGVVPTVGMGAEPGLSFGEATRFDPADIPAYAYARLKSLSWGSPPAVSAAGSQRLTEVSGGIARKLNLLLTRLAMHADANDLRSVDADDVERVRSELTAEALLSP